MDSINLGRVRGTVWYSGIRITGLISQGTTFPASGIAKAYINDIYMNTNRTSDSNGNLYKCIIGGDPEHAQWVYVGNIKGPEIGLENNLHTDDHTKALTAAAGKKLKDIIDEAELYPYKMIFDNNEKSYTVDIEIENNSGYIDIVDVNGIVKRTEVQKTSADEKKNVRISLLPLFGNGSVITEIISDLKVYKVKMYDAGMDEVLSADMNMWNALYKMEKNIEVLSTITEEDYDGEIVTYNTCKISKTKSGIRVECMPETHARTVWFNKSKGITMYDMLKDDIKEEDVRGIKY